MTSHRKQYDLGKENWSTKEVAGFLCVSQSFIRKKIEEQIIIAAGGRRGHRLDNRSDYRVHREEVMRLVEDLPPLLPLKALEKLQARHPESPVERRLSERAAESETKLWEERRRRYWEHRKLRIYRKVELLLDERTAVETWGYIGEDGVPNIVSLRECPLCGERMELPPGSTATQRATILQSHLLSSHPKRMA